MSLSRALPLIRSQVVFRNIIAFNPPGVTACHPIPWVGGDNRIPEDQHMRGGAAWPSGPKALLPDWVCRSCLYALSGCLVQPSNPALRPSLELLRPAPLRCGEGKGRSEQCGRKRLHAHKKWINTKWSWSSRLVLHATGSVTMEGRVL